MYIKKLTFISLLSLLIIMRFSGIEKYVDPDLLRREVPPKYLDKGVLITVSPREKGMIYLRTNLDNWMVNHPMKKSFYGVYYIVVPYNYEKPQIEYLLNINGYWETDPNNPETAEDKYGTLKSVMRQPDNILSVMKMPFVEKLDSDLYRITFRFKNSRALEVNLVTSIDNWSIYSRPMEPDMEGYWNYQITLKRGKVLYYFFADGKKFIDIENPDKVFYGNIGEVSQVTLP